MPKVAVKRIKEKILRIQNAWNEGAPEVTEFRNVTKANFDADIAAAQAVEDEIAELRARTRMKEDERDDRYDKLEDDGVDVGKGVVGHKNYGDDSPLYGAMGFVRKSERKSGLTHKKKNDDDDNGENQ
jgi:hypothetical protein